MKILLCCICIIILLGQNRLVFAQNNTYPPLDPVGALRVTHPINRMILQRDNNNNAPVTITGEVMGANFVNKILLYRITQLDPKTGYSYGCPVGSFCPIDLAGSCDEYGCLLNNYQVATLTPIPNDNTTSTFKITPNLPNGLSMGWYILQVVVAKRYYVGATQLWEYTILAYQSKLFGVGDNFVIAGQSNSRGEETDASGFDPNDKFPDNNLIPVYTGYDNSSLLPEAISVINNYSYSITEGQGQRIGGIPLKQEFSKLTNQVFNIYPLGRYSWTYAPLGKKIIEQTGVPTAFFNTGYGGTKVSDFTNSLTNGNAPYAALHNILQSYANIFGIKAILWHQGETDSIDSTSESDYSTRLNAIISQSRTDFGNTNLPWFISNTSLNQKCLYALNHANIPTGCIDNYTNPNIINGQNDVLNLSSNAPIFMGISSDDIIYTGNPSNYGRGPTQKVHFNDQTHLTIGEKWYAANLQQASPIQAQPILTTTVSKVSGQYQLSAPSGYATYIWSKNDEGIYHSTVLNKYSQTITVPYSTNPDIYACYVSNDTDTDQATNGWNLKLQVTAPFVIPNTADAQKLLAVSNNILNYPNSSPNSQVITVSSTNVVWLPNDNSNTWIHFNHIQGAGQGDTPLSITVDPNTSNGRTATILVQEENGGLIQYITINQGTINPCNDYNILFSPYNDYYSGTDTQKANLYLISSNKILNTGTVINYQAGQAIYLNIGTLIDKGTTFKAEIKPCN